MTTQFQIEVSEDFVIYFFVEYEDDGYRITNIEATTESGMVLESIDGEVIDEKLIKKLDEYWRSLVFFSDEILF